MNMKMSSLVCVLTLVFAGHALAAETATNAAIAVSAVLKEASTSNGVLLRVTMENAGPAPYSLRVCPAMTLCCVRGLHPVIDMEETGVGLLDLCRVENPTPHETFLPAGAAFAFNVRIPPANLPEKCRVSGAAFSVHFRFQDKACLANSEPVRVKLTP